MTEAESTHPSQRRRFPKADRGEETTHSKASGDVSSLFKAALVAALSLLSSSLIIAPALADSHQTASLVTGALQNDGPARAAIELPAVLNATEARRYRRIFDLHEAARWQDADQQIAQLGNPILLGHALAQRYLHPRYRSQYHELAAWLDHYADHPDARRIHDLALKRKPAHLAAPAAPRNGNGAKTAGLRVPGAEPPAERWTPALDAFRAKRYAAAAKQFETVARLPKASPWVVSAGAFWAARAHLLAGQPDQVTRWLSAAAAHPFTFYGLLARETLGIDNALTLRDPMLHAADSQSLIAVPGGARAVALLRIGEMRRAEQELVSINAADAGVARAIVALANHGNMPALSLRLGNQPIGLDKAEHDAAIYPIPAWVPRDGFDVDRALIYALIRRESSFNPQARNPSGASGLMQLMPGTAKAVAGERLAAHRVLEPETNMALGQGYIRRLMTDQGIGENLILLVAAYNAGPGNAAKWRRQLAEVDPLLFIESLPSRETRIFVETVLTDLWIYRMRLGQSTHSLAELASGRWPMYLAHDARDTQVAGVPR